MPQEFVTVSEAQKLTGKSERTIRRFLKANVDKHPEHFEMETQSGREIWLIESEFLSRHYPLAGGGESDTTTSRDSAGQNVHGAKTLQKEWQKSKQDQHDNNSSTNGDLTENDSGKHENDRDKVVSGDTAELWKLIHAQQEEIKKKDEQLDRYFTGQQEMMQTLGRLMEQDNLLLARSQEASIGGKNESTTDPADTKVVEIQVEEQVDVEAKVATPSKKTKEKTKSRSSVKKKSAKTNEPKKKSWWGVFGSSD